MARDTCADLFVRSLSEAGIDTIFALPGEETGDLMDALARSDIEIVLCRHEQAAAFMASVHGRLTGKPAACLATLGPGATNLVTGVADATLDLVPLIAITGQGGRDRIALGRNSHQIIDLDRLFEPVTKLSRTLRRADEIAGAVAEAVRVATCPRPGAVHLSMPEDLAGQPAGDAPAPKPVAPAHIPYPNPKALAEAVDRMARAERPMILVGAGVGRARTDADASAAFRDFAQRTGYPVATSFMAKGAMEPDATQHLGAFGLPVEDHVDRAIAQSDLILAVGLDPVEYPVAKLTDDGRIPVVNVVECALPHDLGWDVCVDVIGDMAATLTALGKAAEPMPELWDAAKAARAAWIGDVNHGHTERDASPPPDTALVAALNDTLRPGDVLLSGVGTHKLSLARNLLPQRPGQVVIANGLAGMGLALPGAIAAARLGRYDRVLAVCGDGDVMMNVQDMETATRLDLPLTVIVWVDGGYGLIEDKQEADTGTRPELRFAGTDWAQLAAAFGWSHIACRTARDLCDVLQSDAADARQLISIPVTYDGTLA